MAKEYKSRGGEYNQPKSQKDSTQQNLTNWDGEKWQTKEGSAHAKKNDGTQKRYLPKKAWEQMDEKEKEETDEKKQEETKVGKQFVANTGRARRARKNATEEDGETVQEEKKEKKDAEEKTGQKRGRAKKERESEPEQEEENEDEAEGKEQEPPKKQAKKTSGKKGSEKTIGSKHDKADPPAQQASAKRLPKKNTNVWWKAMPGWVDGKVVEILKSNKEVDGKQVKASKDDPRIVLKSNAKSGKICVHKPEAVYFD